MCWEVPSLCQESPWVWVQHCDSAVMALELQSPGEENWGFCWVLVFMEFFNVLELGKCVCTEPGLAGIRLQGVPASAATLEPRFRNISHCPLGSSASCSTPSCWHWLCRSKGILLAASARGWAAAGSAQKLSGDELEEKCRAEW